MDRLIKFKSLENDAWYGPQYKKLRKKDIDFCINWIEARKDICSDKFERDANRMFLDNVPDSETNADRKRRRICQELISVCA